ncbi:MAG: thiamine phosphate synthase [Chloroflexota bacterium]|nr:thiamine phosphate synthase [Chloroflexota bacterium]
MNERFDLGLYVITDAGLSRGQSHLEVIRAAIAGGVTVVQYREKEATTRRMVEEAKELRELCREAGVPFIVNDRLDVALAVGADGVHVGQFDMPASTARRLLGPDKLLGVSASTVAEARQAKADGADYISASPVFSTPTKPDAPQPTGVEGLRAIVKTVGRPVVAIGGVKAHNAAQLIQAGAAGVAVVSAIVAAEDVEAAARELRDVVEAARGGGLTCLSPI